MQEKLYYCRQLEKQLVYKVPTLHNLITEIELI